MIKGKLSSLMSQKELEVEQLFLTEKLKHVSKYLDRLVDKEYILKQVIEGKEKG